MGCGSSDEISDAEDIKMEKFLRDNIIFRSEGKFFSMEIKNLELCVWPNYVRDIDGHTWKVKNIPEESENCKG